MQNWLMVALAGLAFVVMAAIWVYTHRKRTQDLRVHFGTEYDRTVLEFGDRWSAERELVERRKKLSARHIRPLTAQEAGRFGEQWQSVQAAFDSDPRTAVLAADRLITAVLKVRGYEAGDLQNRLSDVSSGYPTIVASYRLACTIVNRGSLMTAKDMRTAMVLYRSLFAELFEDRGSRRTA